MLEKSLDFVLGTLVTGRDRQRLYREAEAGSKKMSVQEAVRTDTSGGSDQVL